MDIVVAGFAWFCIVAMITFCGWIFHRKFNKEQDRRLAWRRQYMAERQELLDMLAKVRAEKAANAKKQALVGEGAATPAE